MTNIDEKLIKQIDALLARFPKIKNSWFSGQMVSGFKENVEYESAITEILSLITHLYGNGHPHTQRVINAINQRSLHSFEHLEGILFGTKNNIQNGLLSDLEAKISLEIKTDFLSTANEFLDEGHKDPAAVLACTVLEDSLKQLASKHKIEKALNKEMSVVANMLLGEKIIEKSTNQAIQSFKSLRNAAFHAQWNEVSEETVRMLLVFLPAFLEKHEI